MIVRLPPVAPLFLAAGLALFALAQTGQAHAGSDTVIVSLDRAQVVKLPEGTQTLIIGNPLVADVTLLKNYNSMVVTGRSFGATNLIALDANGVPVAESIIKVKASDNALVVLRGLSQESYSCTPRCAPTVALGDEGKFMNESIGNAKSRNGASLSGNR